MSVRKDRMSGVFDAINDPSAAIGINGLAARMFRLLAADAISDQQITPAQLNQYMRAFAQLLTEDQSRKSNAQQEFSNLISAWVNPTMPLARVVQAMGVFGATEVEFTLNVKFDDKIEPITRTLSIPISMRIEKEESNGVEYAIPILEHNEIMDREVHPETEPEL